jgi:hypothetical protein
MSFWLLVYVDDILVISHKPQEMMDRIGETYELKGSVARPDRYLGAIRGMVGLYGPCQDVSMFKMQSRS